MFWEFPLKNAELFQKAICPTSIRPGTERCPNILSPRKRLEGVFETIKKDIMFRTMAVELFDMSSNLA